MTSFAIRLGDLTKDNYHQFRRLNLAVFPVRYSDKFYADALLDDRKSLTKLAFHNDVLVGAVGAKLEQPDLKIAKLLSAEYGQRIYIMTLGVLAPYRHHGIGRKLLTFILEQAEKMTEVSSVFLHVQTSNAEALAFYESFGFAVTGTIAGYYKKIVPPDCYIVEKKIVRGFSTIPSTSTSANTSTSTDSSLSTNAIVS